MISKDYSLIYINGHDDNGAAVCDGAERRLLIWFETRMLRQEAEGKASPDRRIAFRIGVHQGDVVVENNDLFGDGVNVAARLEALSEAGGICI